MKRHRTALIIFLVLTASSPLGWWLAYSPHRLVAEVGSTLLVVELMATFLVCVAPILMVVALVELVSEKRRQAGARHLVLALAIAGGFYGGLVLGRQVQKREIVAFVARSDVVVDALRRYVEERGGPPMSLTELLPQHLPSVPTTGFALHPDYLLLTGKDAARHANNPWVLKANPPSLLMGFDILVYLPNQNYPDVSWGGWIERFDRWAYVHE